MARPRFSLTDHQARQVAEQISRLREQYPFDPHNHRAFSGAFIRAIYDITGKLYGPVTYRRLMEAYVPDRNPSTTTLADERRQLERALAIATSSRQRESHAVNDVADMSSARLHVFPDSGDQVRAALADFLPQVRQLVNDSGRQSEFEFLIARLADTEQRWSAAQAQAAQLAADFQKHSAVTALLQEQLHVSQASHAREQLLVKQMAEELTGQRLFALQAIEASRAETRLIKERVQQLERDIQSHENTIEQLRMARNPAPSAMGRGAIR